MSSTRPRTALAGEESELRKLELLAEKEGGIVVQVTAPAAGEVGAAETSRWRNSLS